MKIKDLGGDERIRTADLPRAKRTLCQLSYAPLNFPRPRFLVLKKLIPGGPNPTKKWWA